MTTSAKRIIVVVAAVQLALAVGIFALPRAVQALPGRYLVRLQGNPLTGSIVELVTTPLPQSLPVADGGGQRASVASGDLPDIPGLPENRPTSTPAPATPTPATVAAVETTPTPTDIPPTPTSTATPMPTPTPPPDSVVLDGLITIAQGFNNCGPANMTIALNYFGNDTTQDEAADYLKPNEEDRNVSPWQISDYVNEFTNLRSTAHSGGTVKLLKELIAAGYPVVIEKGYEPPNGTGWYGHYLTVYGYDDDAQQFYSRDTNLGPFDGRPRLDSYEEFNRWWQHFNYTFYVIYPPEEESTVTSIIPNELRDPITMWQHTAEIARREIAADPDDAFTHFNLGVSLTWLGQETGDPEYYQQATVAFDESREIGLPPRTLYYEHRPLMAYWKAGRLEDVLELTDSLLDTSGGRWIEEIHWYRGHVLAAQGSLIAARDSYQESLEVNPNFYPAQQSLDWVNSLLSG